MVVIDPRGIRLFVEGCVLFHRRTISDRVDPNDLTTPTPFLVPNSVLEVRLVPIGAFRPAPVGPSLEYQDPDVGSSEISITPPPKPTLGSDDRMTEENETIEEFTYPVEEVLDSDSDLEEQSSSSPAPREFILEFVGRLPSWHRAYRVRCLLNGDGPVIDGITDRWETWILFLWVEKSRNHHLSRYRKWKFNFQLRRTGKSRNRLLLSYRLRVTLLLTPRLIN